MKVKKTYCPICRKKLESDEIEETKSYFDAHFICAGCDLAWINSYDKFEQRWTLFEDQ